MNISKQKTDQKRAVHRRIMQVFITFVLQFALLFIPAWKLNWPMAWALMGAYLLILLYNSLIVFKGNPELIAERGQPKEGVKPWDKTITTITIPFTLFLPVIIGFDERYAWSVPFPLWMQILGLILIILGQLLFSWSMSANKYFSTMVRIQEERGHKVAQSGPYRFVRHPGYVGYILFTLATPICLASLWALIPAGLISALLILRTALEDKTLLEELPGYKEYVQKVRFRIIPGIW